MGMSCTKAMVGFNNTTDGDTIQSMLLNKCMSLLLANCRIVNKTTVLKNFKYKIYKELHMYIVNFVLSFEFI